MSIRAFQKLILVGIVAVVVIVLSVLSDDFLTFKNFSNVSRQVAMVIITGCGVTLLMIAGQIDLSVGSVLALTGVLFAQFSVLGIPVGISALLASLVIYRFTGAGAGL